jgi:hypothetical protein
VTSATSAQSSAASAVAASATGGELVVSVVPFACDEWGDVVDGEVGSGSAVDAAASVSDVDALSLRSWQSQTNHCFGPCVATPHVFDVAITTAHSACDELLATLAPGT